MPIAAKSQTVSATTIRRRNIIRVHNERVVVLSAQETGRGRICIRYLGNLGEDTIEVSTNAAIFRYPS